MAIVKLGPIINISSNTLVLTSSQTATLSSISTIERKIIQWQDFAVDQAFLDALSANNNILTLSAAENGTGINFDATKVVDNDIATTIIYKANDKKSPVYKGIALLSNIIKVTAVNGANVTLSDLPSINSGSIRICYLYKHTGLLPTDYQHATHGFDPKKIESLDLYYTNKQQHQTDIDSLQAQINNNKVEVTLYNDPGANITFEPNLVIKKHRLEFVGSQQHILLMLPNPTANTAGLSISVLNSSQYNVGVTTGDGFNIGDITISGSANHLLGYDADTGQNQVATYDVVGGSLNGQDHYGYRVHNGFYHTV